MSLVKTIPFTIRESIRKLLFGSSPNTDIVKSLKNTGKKDLCMIDVGAETGYESIVAEKNGFFVYAFEPDERMFRRLTQNVQMEKVKNISLQKKGVSLKDGKATFYFGDNEAGRSSLIADEKLENSATIDLVRLDTFCNKNQLKPDYIKIDAEGISFEVLKSYDFSSHSPTFILIEPDDENEVEIKSFLKEKKYIVFHSVFKAKELGERTILKRYDYNYDKNVEFADIVAVHNDSFHLWNHGIGQ